MDWRFLLYLRVATASRSKRRVAAHGLTVCLIMALVVMDLQLSLLAQVLAGPGHPYLREVTGFAYPLSFDGGREAFLRLALWRGVAGMGVAFASYHWGRIMGLEAIYRLIEAADNEEPKTDAWRLASWRRLAVRYAIMGRLLGALVLGVLGSFRHERNIPVVEPEPAPVEWYLAGAGTYWPPEPFAFSV